MKHRHRLTLVLAVGALLLGIAVAVVVKLPGAYSRLVEQPDSTSPGPPVSPKSLVLHDVQGLWGGEAIWVSGDRAATVQVVGKAPAGQSGLWEKRFRHKLTDQEWEQVERLVGAHHFMTLQLPERAGIPDEGHPLIWVETADGRTHKVMKWDGDSHPDFNPLQKHLSDLCRSADRGEPIWEGPYDWGWRPDGFAPLW